MPSCEGESDVAYLAARCAATWLVQLRERGQYGLPSYKAHSNVAGVAKREVAIWPT